MGGREGEKVSFDRLGKAGRLTFLGPPSNVRCPTDLLFSSPSHRPIGNQRFRVSAEMDRSASRDRSSAVEGTRAVETRVAFERGGS